jgi:hypothetical protein
MEGLTHKADYRYFRSVAQEQQGVCWRKEPTLTAMTSNNVFSNLCGTAIAAHPVCWTTIMNILGISTREHQPDTATSQADLVQRHLFSF